MDLAAALRGVVRRPQPWPEPEPGPWRSARFSVVDLETTGLDLRRDEVISLGVVTVSGGRLQSDRWHQVVRPSRPISPESVKVHALTPDEVAEAPPLEDVLGAVRARLRGTVLVAHAAWVERAFLDRALRSRRERLPDEVVDTAALARAAGLVEAGSYEPDLESLARRLGLPVHTPHHALGDAVTTAQVLLVLVARLEATAGRALDVRDLVRLTRRHPLGEPGPDGNRPGDADVPSP
ncbi:MAG: 3'-5' exonuclease [Nocardioidaceae bacterium]